MKIQNAQKIKKLVFNTACILCPSITFWILWPVMMEFPPIMITQNLNLIQIYLGASYWIEIFSAPGFIYALFKNDLSGSGKWLKKWVRTSLHTAFYASPGVLIISLWVVLPGPFAIGTVVFTYLVLEKYKAQKVST